MDTHARQIETKHARSPPAGPMRHWGNMGHMGHMVKKAGQFGDPEISLGWRHSGQGPAESRQTAPQKGAASGLGRGVRHTEMGCPITP